ncbi:ABC transporter permease [Leptolyngbya sp. 15MV]|nr:ABC transporter permease [Leptolyngbya sp. 15MV]
MSAWPTAKSATSTGAEPAPTIAQSTVCAALELSRLTKKRAVLTPSDPSNRLGRSAHTENNPSSSRITNWIGDPTTVAMSEPEVSTSRTVSSPSASVSGWRGIVSAFCVSPGRKVSVPAGNWLFPKSAGEALLTEPGAIRQSSVSVTLGAPLRWTMATIAVLSPVPSAVPEGADFAMLALPGLALWLSVQAAMARGGAALIGAANLVKQVVFPIELLPIRSVLGAQLPLLVGLMVVLAYALARFQTVPPLLPLLAYVIAAQIALLAGLALLLAAATVFLRDLRDIVQFLLTIGLFLTPAIYLPGSLPGWFAALLWLNPFSHAIWCLQDIFYFRAIAHPVSWVLLGVLGAAALWAGARVFEAARPRFGDAL